MSFHKKEAGSEGSCGETCFVWKHPCYNLAERDNFLHFIEVHSEVQRGEVTSPRSHTQARDRAGVQTSNGCRESRLRRARKGAQRGGGRLGTQFTRSTWTSRKTVEKSLKHEDSGGPGATIPAQEEWETVSPKSKLALPYPSCVTQGKSLHFSGPQCPHL